MAKRRFYIILVFLLLALFLSTSSFGQEQTITVGSFNLEWLGHGFKARDQKDISTLAQYIKTLEVDVFCFQEVSPTGDVTGNGITDWQDLLTALNTPEELYQARVGTTGSSQKLAFL